MAHNTSRNGANLFCILLQNKDKTSRTESRFAHCFEISISSDHTYSGDISYGGNIFIFYEVATMRLLFDS